MNEPEWKNLAPEVTRQRVIMEGLREENVNPQEILDYLEGLARITEMEVLSGPGVYTAHEAGMMGWIHWRTSGTQLYAFPLGFWRTPPREENRTLVTVDCYTCKPFDAEKAADYTKNQLRLEELVWQEVAV